MKKSDKSRRYLGSYPPISLSTLTLVVVPELAAYTHSNGIPTNSSGKCLIIVQCFISVNGDKTRPLLDTHGTIAAMSCMGATNAAACQSLHMKSIGRLVS